MLRVYAIRPFRSGYADFMREAEAAEYATPATAAQRSALRRAGFLGEIPSKPEATSMLARLAPKWKSRETA